MTATTDPFSDLGLHTSATMTVDKPEMACIQFDHKDVDPLVGLVAELAQTSAGGTSAVRITFRAVAEREVKRRLGYVGRVV